LRFKSQFPSDQVEKYNEPRMNADERGFVHWVSAFIGVHLRLIRTKRNHRSQKIIKSHRKSKKSAGGRFPIPHRPAQMLPASSGALLFVSARP
jgi:hypothetical protein